MKSFNNIYGVIGSPILHSKSPYIYNALFSLSILFDSYYIRIAVDNAEEIVELIKSLDLKGVNITSPFKQDIIKYLDEIDDHSKKINAVNTILNKEGNLKGYNTDFTGVTETLTNKLGRLLQKKCLVIGCGGAGRAAAYGLTLEQVDVTIISRSMEKAMNAAMDFNCNYAHWEDLESEIAKADFCVNTIPYSYLNIDDFFKENQTVLNADYTMTYYEAPFNPIDGTEWLLNQAYPAFDIFTSSKNKKNIVLPKSFNSDEIRKEYADYIGERKNNISLIGFIGSGKTTVGKALAKKLNWNFIDTDELIVEQENKPIKKIFDDKGEDYFRKLETDILKSLTGKKNSVISCGGGMILKEENRLLLKQISNVFWIYSPISICLERLKDGLRPPLTDPFDKIDNPIEKAEILFELRIPYYCEIADALFYNNKSVEKSTNKIYDEVHTLFGY